jgi:hypothetical protein
MFTQAEAHLKRFALRSSAILVSFICCLVSLPANAASSKDIQELRGAISDQKWDQAASILSKSSSALTAKFDDKEAISLMVEAGARLKNLATPWNSFDLLNSYEAATKEGNVRETYVRLNMLRRAMMNQLMGQDPMPRSFAAKQKAAMDGSFQNLYDLALKALMAKQYSDCLAAAEAAWLLRDQESILRMSADGMHSVQQIGALAAIELSQIDLAKTLMMRSVNLPGRNWARTKPDVHAAKRLLAAQQRGIVLEYLEAAAKIPWRTGNEEINGWISQLKQGQTPDLP